MSEQGGVRVTEEGDGPLFAEACSMLNADREMCRAYAGLAYTRARERFTTRRMIDDCLQVYRSLTSAGSLAA